MNEKLKTYTYFENEEEWSLVDIFWIDRGISKKQCYITHKRRNAKLYE